MSLDGLIDPGAGRGDNPRNAWSRLRRALDIAAAPGRPERWHLAWKILESVRHSPDLTEAVFDVYARQIDALRPADLPPAPVNGPADYLGHDVPIHHRAFRRLDPASRPPKPFPFGLALPGLVGGQNDAGFLYDAATALGAAARLRDPAIHVFYDAARARGPREVTRLMQDIAAQDHDGPVRLTLFGAPDDLPVSAPPGCPVPDRVAEDLLAEAAQGHIAARIDTADIALFLSGSARLDPTALARIAYPGRVTQKLVQILKPLGEDDGQKITPFSLTALRPMLTMRYPFRDTSGLNMAVPTALLRQAGLLDPRFSSRFAAGRELAFRLYNHGAWFAPLALPEMTRGKDHVSEDDARLYTGLAPNHWDRKKDHARYEVPKVSVYIPTYNASNYIERAVDSVLEQDFRDLEVCLANDGSFDHTLEILERRYGDERRVRWLANPNGGIGFASNTAIGMARGLYIGQLDSDDCLKPGAVRRLATYLDENPSVVCAYGSCERIDAQGHYLRTNTLAPVLAREDDGHLDRASFPHVPPHGLGTDGGLSRGHRQRGRLRHLPQARGDRAFPPRGRDALPAPLARREHLERQRTPPDDEHLPRPDRGAQAAGPGPVLGGPRRRGPGRSAPRHLPAPARHADGRLLAGLFPLQPLSEAALWHRPRPCRDRRRRHRRGFAPDRGPARPGRCGRPADLSPALAELPLRGA